MDGSIRALRSALDASGVISEIIIVDDGSTDRTGPFADVLANNLAGVRAFHQQNQGIGGAFRTGVSLSNGDYVMLWPADMPATADDLRVYTRYLGTVDVIVGCRRSRAGYNSLMLLNAWMYPKLVGMLFGLKIRDVNWIHVYRRSTFLNVRLSQQGIPMLAEALVRLRDAGASFVEVDVDMRERDGGIASASRLRVMWRTLSGLLTFWYRRRQEISGTRKI